MLLRPIILLSTIVVAVFAFDESLDGSCSGAFACAEGYCCSSHGYCGRTTYHCSGTNGCDPARGSCGVVFLDKDDAPLVIPYEQIDPDHVKQLADQLEKDGAKLDPEQLKNQSTLESVLQAAAEDKIKLVDMFNENNGPSTKPGSSSDPTAKPDDSSSSSPSKLKPSKSPTLSLSGVAARDSSDNILATVALVFSAIWIVL
ncbi:hypothetical protein DFQ27_009162 [Actinomortierella ambigua]|uniref:Chitin-binding type-1 domain-containing protein n=1 Tax=Actinomortierella ambigua TaxID=1343610 RepID=A0A9P6PS30_9FUNG|nr:hypothetical protein DFQ27_009162 [Actinomortierella ambigua]